MMSRLPVLAMAALLAATVATHAETIPGAAGAVATPAPAPVPAPPAMLALLAPGPAVPDVVSGRFIAVAAGVVVGALMPQLTVVDGLVLMSAVMGGMIGDMAYNSAHGMTQK